MITNPDWARKPSGEDIARYYPDRAQRMEVEGRVTLTGTPATLTRAAIHDAYFGVTP